jgi:hypothetical protein
MFSPRQLRGRKEKSPSTQQPAPRFFPSTYCFHPDHPAQLPKPSHCQLSTAAKQHRPYRSIPRVGGQRSLFLPICSFRLVVFCLVFADLSRQLVRISGAPDEKIGNALGCGSLNLGNQRIHDFCIFIVEIDTRKCFYCPQKGAFVVLWDSLSPADQNFQQDKHPDSGEGAVCDVCVRSARPWC